MQGVANRDIKLENTLLERLAAAAHQNLRLWLLEGAWPQCMSAMPYSIQRWDSGCIINLKDEHALCHTVQHELYNSAPGSRVGTPAYLAPEVILTTKGKTYNAKVHPLRSRPKHTASSRAGKTAAHLLWWLRCPELQLLQRRAAFASVHCCGGISL